MTTRTLDQHRAAAAAGAASSLRELHRDPWNQTAESSPEVEAPSHPMRRGRARFTHYRGAATRHTRTSLRTPRTSPTVNVPSEYYVRLLADGFSIVEIVTGKRLAVSDPSPAALTSLVLDELTALLSDNPDTLRNTAHLARAARYVLAELTARTGELAHAQHLTEVQELTAPETLPEHDCAQASHPKNFNRAHTHTHPSIAPTSEALTVRLIAAPGAPNSQALLG